jgi:hypothetical protein
MRFQRWFSAKSMITGKPGTAAYYRQRLERDHPRLARAVDRGELSVFAACLRAGLRKPPQKRPTRPSTEACSEGGQTPKRQSGLPELKAPETIRLILEAFDAYPTVRRDAAIDIFCRVWPKLREAHARQCGEVAAFRLAARSG